MQPSIARVMSYCAGLPDSKRFFGVSVSPAWFPVKHVPVVSVVKITNTKTKIYSVTLDFLPFYTSIVSGETSSDGTFDRIPRFQRDNFNYQYCILSGNIQQFLSRDFAVSPEFAHQSDGVIVAKQLKNASPCFISKELAVGRFESLLNVAGHFHSRATQDTLRRKTEMRIRSKRLQANPMKLQTIIFAYFATFELANGTRSKQSIHTRQVSLPQIDLLLVRALQAIQLQ